TKINSILKEKNMFSKMYDNIDFGVCIIHFDGSLIFANKLIQEYKSDLFKISLNQIKFPNPDNQKNWNKLISNNKEHDFSLSESNIAVFSTTDHQKIIARAISLPDILIDQIGVSDKCKVVFFYNLNTLENNTIELLRALGLSRSEALLAHRLGCLMPLKDCAQSLSISYESARSSLKTIFMKLNINSQNELIALLTKLSFIR
ncbi:helix-turn-helix transcriptional regulator, partial [Acetobacter orientalis]